MLDNAFLVTPALIGTDEVASFLIKFGGSVHPDHPGYGWIPQGEWRVRVGFGAECDADVLADAILENEEAVTTKLAAAPQSCVELEISRTPGSEIVAVDFAVAFAEHWPSIVIDVEGHVLDLADLKGLQRKGKGFGTDSALPA
jgi:hypothetical protein